MRFQLIGKEKRTHFEMGIPIEIQNFQQENYRLIGNAEYSAE
jgi:hypothetical protein